MATFETIMAAFFSIVTDPKKTRQARALYPPTLSTSGPSQRPELSLETPWKRAVPFPRRDGKGTPTLELPAPCLLRNPPTSPVSPQVGYILKTVSKRFNPDLLGKAKTRHGLKLRLTT